MQTSGRDNRVPAQLRAGIAALLVLTGAGAGMYAAHESQVQDMLRHEYVQAVAADTGVSRAVQVAMVMGAYYESSYRHIGTPYIDKLGKGQPLTVCAGLTGPDVVPGKTYSPADCYRLERARYIGYERWLRRDLPLWDALPLFTQAALLDFAHNKGTGNFSASTMRRKLLAGDLVGACRENERWTRGTVGGVSTVLPGLKVRGDANADICLWDAPVISVPAMPGDVPPVAAAPEDPQPAPPAPWWRRLFGRS